MGSVMAFRLRFSRRLGGLMVIGVAGLSAVVPPASAAVPPAGPGGSCAPGVRVLGFSDALDKTSFGGTDVGGLSGLAPAPGRDTYRALVDNQKTTAARFYTLRIPLRHNGLPAPKVTRVTTLRDAGGTPFTGANFDGEGLTTLPDSSLLASSETEPSIRRFAPDGRLLGALPVPQRFRVSPAGQAQGNATFEGLTRTPSGRGLYTAVERPLSADGGTADGHSRIRILRYAREHGRFAPAGQFYYLAEPNTGVAELVAVGEHELLVLERGFETGVGNTIRVFAVSLRGAPDVTGVPSLAAAGRHPVRKRLLVDVANCPPSGATSPGQQRNPLLDNYEAMTLGPRLPGNGRALLLLSDDNFGTDQVTRLLALRIPAHP